MIKITEGVSHFLFNKLRARLVYSLAGWARNHFMRSGLFHISIDRQLKDDLDDFSLSYLNVHIAVGIEGAVDHMQRDIYVRYRMKKVNDHWFLHLHAVSILDFTPQNSYFTFLSWALSLAAASTRCECRGSMEENTKKTFFLLLAKEEKAALKFEC